jgi:hypothetical protein
MARSICLATPESNGFTNRAFLRRERTPAHRNPVNRSFSIAVHCSQIRANPEFVVLVICPDCRNRTDSEIEYVAAMRAAAAKIRASSGHPIAG